MASEAQTPCELAAADCSGNPNGETTYDKLRRVASQLENQMCSHFPHLICNEVQGLAFDHWCESCKARAVMESIRRSETNSLNGKDDPR